MVRGGIDPNDLVMLIGEQTISIRLLEQSERDLQVKINQLENEVDGLKDALARVSEPNGL